MDLGPMRPITIPNAVDTEMRRAPAPGMKREEGMDVHGGAGWGRNPSNQLQPEAPPPSDLETQTQPPMATGPESE